MTRKDKKNIVLVKRILLTLSLFIFITFSCVFVTIGIFYNKYTLDIDQLTSINNGVKVSSANATDTNICNTDRSLASIETLPDYVAKAFIDTEDKRFYTHNGYDLARIVKASMVNLTTRSKTQGASTISQQLIKNALLSNEKTYDRKIEEIILSIKMEKQFSKDEILEMYLNTIYFGANSYGIENASRVYFAKSAKDLTLNEACCLAGIIKSPKTYSPRLNYEKSTERRNFVAYSLLKNNDISIDEYNEVVSSEIKLADIGANEQSYEEMAILEACSLLHITERELINREYEIITFKDDTLQNEVVDINNTLIANSKETTNSPLDSLSVVLDNEGKVLAYYENSYYNLHNMKRQPASTLKPLAVYLPCIIHNILSPASLILDDEIDYDGFSPNNADNQFHGYVSTRYALSHSLNIPAVKALDYVGLKKSKEILTDLGINVTNADMNLGLALGSMQNGVKLLDLVSAYSVLANQGEYKGVSFVSQILDKNGKIVYSFDNFSEKVFSEEDCFLVTDMLKDTAKDGTAKRLSSLNLPIASKTGTASNGTNNTDLYNISYSTQHTLMTWVSNLQSNILPKSLHSSVEPTEINKSILKYLYKDTKPSDFKVPSGVRRYAFDTLEAAENHRIVTPTTSSERYISYDYFKDNMRPSPISSSQQDISQSDFNVQLDKHGAILTFSAKKNQTYNVIKVADGEKYILTQIREKSGNISLTDSDVFNYKEITYNLQCNDLTLSECKIKPKDYLVNYLNQEILLNKKKWFV